MAILEASYSFKISELYDLDAIDVPNVAGSRWPSGISLHGQSYGSAQQYDNYVIPGSSVKQIFYMAGDNFVWRYTPARYEVWGGDGRAIITEIYDSASSSFVLKWRIYDTNYSAPALYDAILTPNSPSDVTSDDKNLIKVIFSSKDTITGSNSDDVLCGFDGDDTIYGRNGFDTIDGGPGADTMAGGDGNDTYVVDNIGDILTELPNQGKDTVSSFITYTLGVNVEDLMLVGSATINGTGNALVNDMRGNTASNILNGGVGNDTINAGGGSDTIIGGPGDDILYGGPKNDSFVFTTSDLRSKISSYDRIMDYTKGKITIADIIDFNAPISIGGSNSVASSLQASINQTSGIATFAYGSGLTIIDAQNDIATRFTATSDSPGEFAFFKINNSGAYYLFISDGISGVSTSDIVIQLVGITSINSINLNNGNLAITS